MVRSTIDVGCIKASQGNLPVHTKKWNESFGQVGAVHDVQLYANLNKRETLITRLLMHASNIELFSEYDLQNRLFSLIRIVFVRIGVCYN